MTIIPGSGRGDDHLSPQGNSMAVMLAKTPSIDLIVNGVPQYPLAYTSRGFIRQYKKMTIFSSRRHLASYLLSETLCTLSSVTAIGGSQLTCINSTGSFKLGIKSIFICFLILRLRHSRISTSSRFGQRDN